MKIRVVGTLTGLLLPLVSIGFAGVADAQSNNSSCVAQIVGRPEYPPAAPRLQVDRNTVPAGGSLVASGCGTPSGTVSFTLRSHPINLGTATTDATGFYRAALAIPCDAEQGAHTLTASGAANDSTTVNVSGTTGSCAAAAGTGTGTAGGGGGGNLPRTGSATTAPLTAAGVGLVLIGAATAVTARRRRSVETA